MNVIAVSGNLTKDAEVRYLPNGGDAVCSFSVADNQGKDKPAIFWNCSLFGKRAESLSPYLTKGNPVTVTGTVTERKWTDKDGVERASREVRVNDIALQGGRQGGETAAPRASQPLDREAARNRQAAVSRGEQVEDQDIPF
jgi:single-strand DNA-binding protein